MKKFIFAIFILISTVLLGQNSVVEVPTIAVKIPLGEMVNFKGVSIKFTEVMEDSRCPTGVQCVWAGRIKIKAEVSEKGKTTIKEIIFGQANADESDSKILYTSDKFTLTAEKIIPYPTSENNIEKEEYCLLVSEGEN